MFRDQHIPDDKILMPGVLATTTNYIEHPLLVAERIERFADIAYLKLAALVEGARLASKKLWG